MATFDVREAKDSEINKIIFSDEGCINLPGREYVEIECDYGDIEIPLGEIPMLIKALQKVQVIIASKESTT